MQSQSWTPARKADCHTRLVAREGNAPIAYEHFHARVETLEGIWSAGREPQEDKPDPGDGNSD